MKRVKIALTVVAALGIVGGALAFKARENQALWIHQAGSPADACTFKQLGITTNPLLGNPRTTLASTTSVASGCKTITIYDGQ